MDRKDKLLMHYFL